jgi:amidophosphoribosyltransferase
VDRDDTEIARTINVDSLRYLSLDGVIAATRPDTRMCHGCFSGRYPVALDHAAGDDAPIDSLTDSRKDACAL